MLDGKFPHSIVPVLFTLNGQIHELLIYTRYPLATGQKLELFESDPELLGKIVQSTIGCWARAWASIMQDEWVVSGQSASDQHDIVDKPDNPFCTVQNKDYNGMTLTVHSYDNGQKAVDTVAASLYAIDAIDALKSGMIEIKNAPPKKKQQSTNTTQVDDNESFVPPENQLPQEDHNSSLLKRIQISNDGSVFLPMAKENDMRKARFADKNIDYNGKPRQYNNGELIVYRIFLIEPATVGQSNLHTIKITSTYGFLNIFVNKPDGKEETFDFKTIRDSIAKVGIDANGVFKINRPLAYVVKIAHSTDKNDNEIEYKNAYGLWRLPESES